MRLLHALRANWMSWLAFFSALPMFWFPVGRIYLALAWVVVLFVTACGNTRESWAQEKAKEEEAT